MAFSLLPSLFSSATWQIIYVVFSILCLSKLATVIYRLTVHPLAKLPGPFWNRISNWPNFLSAASGDRHIHLWQLHEIYGPVVRFAPNKVSFNTVEAFKAIYDVKSNVKQGSIYETFIASNRGRVELLTSDGAVHSRKRKIVSRAFSEKALRMHEPVVIETQRAWLREVTSKTTAGEGSWTEPISINKWIPYMTIDIVGEIGFSRSFKATTTDRFRNLPETFLGLVKINSPVSNLPPFFQNIMNQLLKSPLLAALVPEEVRKLDKYVDDMIAERVNEELADDSKEREFRDDFVHLFRDSEGSLNPKVVEEAKSESMTLLVAGSETIATCLSATFFYLTHNPRCLERVQSELFSLFNTFDDIKRGPTLSNAKYLRACIDESLRHSPPVSGYLNREVKAGGITIDGTPYPAGIDVGTAFYAMHHNPEIYPRPDEYLPERWLEGTNEGTNAQSLGQDLMLARASFGAFSGGNHACVGRELAYLQMTLLLAQALFLYDIKTPDDGEEKSWVGGGQGAQGQWGRRVRGQYQLKDFFTGHGDGPWIQFKRRV